MNERARAQAADRYKPARIKTIFVAEAPPDSADRYFYFEQIAGQDSLWVNLMRTLYPAEFGKTADERPRKAQWLKRFADDGYFLIDAGKRPIAQITPSFQREALIAADAHSRIEEIRVLAPEAIVLIKKTVFEGLAESFKQAGLPVLNKSPIPFPGSGQQGNFYHEMKKLGF
jgi:hypothetical protein